VENRISHSYPPTENDGLLFLRALREKKPACAIVGFTDHRVEAFKLDRNRFAIFGLNEMWRYHQPELFDCWFEIHDYDGSIENFTKPQKEGGDPDHVKGMAAMANIGMPVFMQTHHPEIPSSVPFPKAFVEADVADGFGLYKTSCPAWELGLALALGFQEIHMYGIDMAQECLSPETPVLTADLRWVACGDLEVGDELFAYDEQVGMGTQAFAKALAVGGDVATMERPVCRRWKQAVVLRNDRLQKPCYRIELADGTTFTASENHKWLTRPYKGNRYEWCLTKDLISESDEKAIPTRMVRLFSPWTDEQSYERGYLAAAFDGEGSLSQPRQTGKYGRNLSLHFTQKPNVMMEEVHRCLRKMGFHFSVTDQGSGVQCTNLLGGRSEVMRFLGQIRPERLLNKLRIGHLGRMQRIAEVPVVSIEYLGECEVVGLETSEKTFIAEGFASHNSEYAEQRNCIEFLLGIAVGRGVKIHIPTNSDILHCWGQYAYGPEGEGIASKLKERHRWLHKEHSGYLHRLANLEAEYKTKRRDLDGLYEEKSSGLDAEFKNKKNEVLALRFQAEGAISDVEYLQRSWTVRARGWRDSPTTDERAADERVKADALPEDQQIHRRITAPFVPSAGPSDEKPKVEIPVDA
jgi:hypothetical protein